MKNASHSRLDGNMDCVKNPDLVYRLGKAQQQETDRMQKRFLIKLRHLAYWRRAPHTHSKRHSARSTPIVTVL